ncbi:MAG TPA: hypothetical protein PKL31_10840 [Fulvivirga sp.]|nr:hypothetical protein [Fulvivirga sp.]
MRNRTTLILVIIVLTGLFKVSGQVKLEQISSDTLSFCFPVTHHKEYQKDAYKLVLSARNLSENVLTNEVFYDIYISLIDSSFYIDPVDYILGPIDNLSNYQWNSKNNSIIINYGSTEKKNLVLLIRNNQVFIEE